MEAQNLLAILICVLASMSIGYLWYSPILFAQSWMKLTGLSQSDLKRKGISLNYIISLISALLEALVLMVVLRFIGAESITEGLKVGFLLWSGFVATTHLTNSLFAQKPLKLFFLDSGYHLVVILVMSAILTLWR